MKRTLCCSLVLVLLAATTIGRANFGDGSAGAFNVPSGVVALMMPNTTLSGNVTAGATQLPVASTFGLLPGYEVIVVGLNGPDAGTYEFAIIDSIQASPPALNLVSPTVNAYGASTTTSVVRVPHFSSVNVAAGATMRANGPIMAFRCNGTVQIDGTVEATGWGYSGAPTIPGGAGRQGASYDGIPGPSTSNLFGGGGGGDSPSIGLGSGGAGGGHSAAGVNGTMVPGAGAGSGGATYGMADLSVIFPGSGGGGGGLAAATGGSSFGGNGGGVVYIAGVDINISASGAIDASGLDGEDGNASTLSGKGGGGGGSGGSIYLVASALVGVDNAGDITAFGGFGGQILGGGPHQVGAGGDGSDGRIRIDGPLTNTGTISPAPFTGTGPTAAADWMLFE